MLAVMSGCHLQPRFRPGLKLTAPRFQPPPATWEECKSYDRSVVGWTATGVVLGVLGGGSGVTTAFFDDKTPKYITGTISVVFGAMTALSSYMATAASKRYTDRCTQNEGGQ